MDDRSLRCHWKAWKQLTQSSHIDIYLQVMHQQTQIDTLLAFAASIREGVFRCSHQVRFQSVETALWHVVQIFVLDSYTDPWRMGHHHDLDLPLRWLLKAFHASDPPQQPKLAVPVSTIMAIAKGYNKLQFPCAMADLVTVLSSICCGGGYTTPPWPHTKHKQPLGAMISANRKNGQHLKNNIHLSNLSAGWWSHTMHWTSKQREEGKYYSPCSILSHLCPVKAIAHWLHHLSINFKTPNALVGSIWIPQIGHQLISDQDITAAAWWGATIDGLPEHDQSIDHILSQSLQTGGAMAFKLNRYESKRWDNLNFSTSTLVPDDK